MGANFFNSTQIIKPFPLISLIKGDLIFFKPFINNYPILTTLSQIFYLIIIFNTYIQTLQASKFPPYVEPCSPGLMQSIIGSSHKTILMGKIPPERPFPKHTISGLIPSKSVFKSFPVLPHPVDI